MLKQIMNRRQFIATGVVTVTGTVAVATSYILHHDQSQRLTVEHIQLPIQSLPESFEGFRIVQLSDFHLYPFTQLELINQSVEMANALNPDIIVLTGDYVWHEVEAMYDLAPALGRLNAKHGVYTIMGNHDLWTDVDLVRRALLDARLPVLENHGLPLTVGKDSIYLAGLDDGWSGQPDLSAALSEWREGMPIVLLMHEPDLADEYALDERIVLQLSGHTHGGQIRFPWVGALILPYLGWKYDQGLYRVKDMWLYTNRGIGVTNEPIRFNCSPEITEITLVRG